MSISFNKLTFDMTVMTADVPETEISTYLWSLQIFFKNNVLMYIFLACGYVDMWV